MNAPLKKQHLIDPEICIRCNTCEETCPIDAVTHDDNNYVVNAEICNYCMDCIAPCPTGAIDNWRIVAKPYSLEEQFSWSDLPAQTQVDSGESSEAVEALEDEIGVLLEEARKGLGGKAVAPHSASKPTVNLYNRGKPAKATVAGNFRLTHADADSDVRHIILDFGDQPFPVLEGQSIGIVTPGLNADGKPHLVRLYSVASARDGEKPNANNLSLTVKREPDGVCSNYLCDLPRGAKLDDHRPVRRDLPAPKRSSVEHHHDLHRHGICAVPSLHRAPAPRHGGRTGAPAAVLRRAPTGGTAVFRSAAEGA